MLVPLIEGREKACFGVTEPNAGLDTTSIETFARRTNDGYVVRGRKIWTTTAQEADKILLLTRTAKKEDGHEADRRHDAVLHDARPREGRGAPHPEDGPRRGGFERGVHRRSVRARTRTASAKKAKASAICSTASIPNAF